MIRLSNWEALPLLTALIVALVATGACSPLPKAEQEAGQDHEHVTEAGMLALPELAPADLDGAALKVVATTSIIADVVAQVGGDAIELTALMGPGQDPHSYEPAARDLTVVSQAHVLFVNGWDLEEALISNLEAVAEDIPFVPVAANCEPLAFGGHESIDPHTWFSIHNVKQWVENIKRVLCDLDPANADTYDQNAEAYLSELDDLETYVRTQLASIPLENRFLVTNHDSFGYFAHEYDFQVLGTVIPSASSLAEPSAKDLSELIQKMQDHGICTIFTETTVSGSLAQAVAAELDGCDNVRVLKLYTGAIGPPGSGADSYLGMFRSNVDTIVDGLK